MYEKLLRCNNKVVDNYCCVAGIAFSKKPCKFLNFLI